MKVTRRQFIKTAAGAAGAAMLAPQFARHAHAAFLQSPPLTKFIQPMRRFGIEIPIATSVLMPGGVPEPHGATYYEIAMREFQDQLHPELAGPTTLRGYGNKTGGGFKHLGGAILATKNTPVRVRWFNELPAGTANQLGGTGIPVDTSVVSPYTYGASLGNDRGAPHLHGGLVPWPSDGGPFHWFSNGSVVRGPSVTDWLPDESGTLTDDYWYPNIQSARFMWYHDHAVGITRLNAYAGLATGYIISDTEEAGLMADLGVVTEHSIPLVVQDKVFQPSGLLWYPNTYDIQFFALGPGLPLPDPSLVPEFWGDTVLVNGTAYPYLEVEPRRYRIRILNACNTRVLSLTLVKAAGKKFPDNAEPAVGDPGPVMTLIGTEGGFLDGSVSPKGAVYTNSQNNPLLLAPAERADLIIDFSKVKPGQFLILHNDAPVPFPGGTPLADFYPKNNKLAVPPLPGFSPNTRTLLQFRVVAPTGTDPAQNPAWVLPPSPAPSPTVGLPPRDLALWETVDEFGRLAQNLGQIAGPLTQLDTPTEVVQAGTVETWNIYNLTADTHPIHFHYFNVRVMSRQAFNMVGGIPSLIGKAMPPGPDEMGWKETVRFNPGEVTTVLVDVPPTTGLGPTGVTIFPSPRLATWYPGFEGAEYVWHCHILEHEEHDMMRPLVVQG